MEPIICQTALIVCLWMKGPQRLLLCLFPCPSSLAAAQLSLPWSEHESSLVVCVQRLIFWQNTTDAANLTSFRIAVELVKSQTVSHLVMSCIKLLGEDKCWYLIGVNVGWDEIRRSSPVNLGAKASGVQIQMPIYRMVNCSEAHSSQVQVLLFFLTLHFCGCLFKTQLFHLSTTALVRKWTVVSHFYPCPSVNRTGHYLENS